MKLAVVFSGGGAPAAYFSVGVARALADARLVPDVLSGVSGGALTAYGLGTGLDAEDLAGMWESLDCTDLFSPRLDFWNLLDVRSLLSRPQRGIPEHLLRAIRWMWMLDNGRARRTFTRYFGAGQRQVGEGRTVIVSAVDQAGAGVVRFTNALPPEHRRSDEFRQSDIGVDHLLATTAVPLLFASGKVSGESFVDAGLVANTPLKPALAYEPDAVIVVAAGGAERPAPPPRSLAEAIGLLAENVAHAALMADYRHAQTVNQLISEAPQASTKKQVEMLLIEPTGMPFTASGFLDFNPRTAREVIDRGREIAAKALASWAPVSTARAGAGR
ncbi:patatin-like phospholipase family protein [Streptomyces sp. HC44]|uniref:Patatin-like phospholipase family protein n=1 Tax=Streptomyces scabichelini TaxID=2711217 RepID=A0A6G4V838_9ACTN|nr:patatin-like phospholipase family protein [Streptomyces scabichelini]NGO10141.1 patatin-like phospholipase family protein [Streptomyces scabichelini]